MTRYIIRRLLIALPVLIGITFINFLVFNAAPGDPITALFMSEGAEQQVTITAETREILRKQLGLDRPLPVRYLIWLADVAQGKLGKSMFSSEPIATVLAVHIGRSIQLMATSLILAMVVGIALGAISALRQYSLLDYSLTLASFIGFSVPTYFWAMLAIFVFAYKLSIFPTFGMTSMTPTAHPILDRIWHLILPAMVLATEHTASWMRYSRTAMLEVIRQDYVTVARAKGLREQVVILRHAVPNALVPLVTLIGLSLPGLFGGSFFVEVLFAWQGIGWLSYTAVMTKDFSLLMGSTLLSAVLVMGANLLADIGYAYVDPRVRTAAMQKT
jgi:peptide/nickel transport system permease protein